MCKKERKKGNDDSFRITKVDIACKGLSDLGNGPNKPTATQSLADTVCSASPTMIEYLYLLNAVPHTIMVH